MNSLRDAVAEIPSLARAEEESTSLPSVDEFLSLIEDESRQTGDAISAYSVYHKYNKAC